MRKIKEIHVVEGIIAKEKENRGRKMNCVDSIECK